MRVNHDQPLPTTSSAYRAIANLNRGFEQDMRNLAALQGFNFFPEENLIAWGNSLGRLQAEASRRLLETLDDRLMNNALYCDRLCWTREKQLEDPDDVLIEAEHRKRELAAEQQRQEQSRKKILRNESTYDGTFLPARDGGFFTSSRFDRDPALRARHDNLV